MDLLVHMEPRRSLLDKIGIEMEIKEPLGTDVDVLNEGGIHPRLEPTILPEARPPDSLG